MTTQAPDATVEALARKLHETRNEPGCCDHAMRPPDCVRHAGRLLAALPGYRLVPVEEWERLADTIDSYCNFCGGDRWTVTADPDQFGEPGEPYQVQCLDSLHACAEQVRAALRPLQEPTDD